MVINDKQNSTIRVITWGKEAANKLKAITIGTMERRGIVNKRDPLDKIGAISIMETIGIKNTNSQENLGTITMTIHVIALNSIAETVIGTTKTAATIIGRTATITIKATKGGTTRKMTATTSKATPERKKETKVRWRIGKKTRATDLDNSINLNEEYQRIQSCPVLR